MSKQKSYTNEFKFKVAIEMIKGRFDNSGDNLKISSTKISVK